MDTNQEQHIEASNENSDFSMSEEKTLEFPDIGEEKLRFFGTVYNTYIKDNNVNVRSFPSLDAEILFNLDRGAKIVVIGTSKEIDSINHYTGNWLNIRVENQWGEDGWVFSKHVENGNFSVSELKIIEMLPREERQSQRLAGLYYLNGIENYVTLLLNKEETQDFYTFMYEYSTESFHYSNVPGAYIWYPQTNELKHITYIETNVESGWVKFTGDLKYIIRDFGTSPSPRGLGVWRVEDGERIFSGLYYRDINLQDYTINVIYRYNHWNISNNLLDKEIIDYAEEYRKNNPVPDDMAQYSKETGLSIELIIVCEFDLDTGVRRIINGQYIYTQ
jgi:hypothetical protein